MLSVQILLQPSLKHLPPPPAPLPQQQNRETGQLAAATSWRLLNSTIVGRLLFELALHAKPPQDAIHSLIRPSNVTNEPKIITGR